MKTRSRNRGITLVELMTTVSVAAVTLSLGVPAFTGVQSSMQRTQASMEMIASFSLARSEAARRGVSVTVCPSSDGNACSDDDAPDWSAGWMVFVDKNGNSNYDSEVGENSQPDEIVHRASFSLAAFTLGSATEIGRGVLFNLRGFPENGGNPVSGQYVYCDDREFRVLTLSYVGRLEQTDSGAGCP